MGQLDQGHVIGLGLFNPSRVDEDLCYKIAASTELAVVATQPNLLHLHILLLTGTVGRSHHIQWSYNDTST